MAKIRVGNVLFNVLAIVTAIAVAFVAFNMICGAKGYAVLSDSMADTLKRGDVVFSRGVSFDDLQVGDVVTIKVGSKGYFTHRITDIDYDNRTLTTRGDANASDDPDESAESMVAGKMWYSIPILGFVSIAFSGMSTVKGLIILAIIAIGLMAVNMILNRVKKRKVRGDNNEQN